MFRLRTFEGLANPRTSLGRGLYRSVQGKYTQRCRDRKQEARVARCKEGHAVSGGAGGCGGGSTARGGALLLPGTARSDRIAARDESAGKVQARGEACGRGLLGLPTQALARTHRPDPAADR